MKKLVVYGASFPDIVQLIDSVNAEQDRWRLIGFLDDIKNGNEDSFMGFPILGGEESIKRYHENGCCFINNVFKTTRARALVADKLNRFDVRYATMVSPDVSIKYAQIGYDCMIMSGVKLGANVVIGNHVGIRLNCLINHDSRLEDMVFVAPGAIICGRVTIREGAYIGAGAIIKNNLTVNPWSTVGAGAVVTKDVKENSTVAVPPARPIGKLGIF